MDETAPVSGFPGAPHTAPPLGRGIGPGGLGARPVYPPILPPLVPVCLLDSICPASVPWLLPTFEISFIPIFFVFIFLLSFLGYTFLTFASFTYLFLVCLSLNLHVSLFLCFSLPSILSLFLVLLCPSHPFVVFPSLMSLFIFIFSVCVFVPLFLLPFNNSFCILLFYYVLLILS